MCVCDFFFLVSHSLMCSSFKSDQLYAGNHGAYHANDAASKDTEAVKVQPIAVPSISVDELKEVTDSFGQKALIGEGSYGRVYYGVLKSGQTAAIKKLDSSRQPDEEFLAQVEHLYFFSVQLQYCTLCIHLCINR